MSECKRSVNKIYLVGGHPALDFTNTVHTWAGERAGAEYLHDFEDVVAWNRVVGLVDPETTGMPQAGSPQQRKAAHRRALALRAALRRIFHSFSLQRSIEAADLDELNRELHATMAFRDLRADGWKWSIGGAPPHAIVGPVVWAAADLIECGPIDRIKQCPPPEGCGWLYLDRSRNRSRRWCSMQTCGNLSKVRAFQKRQSGS